MHTEIDTSMVLIPGVQHVMATKGFTTQCGTWRAASRRALWPAGRYRGQLSQAVGTKEPVSSRVSARCPVSASVPAYLAGDRVGLQPGLAPESRPDSDSSQCAVNEASSFRSKEVSHAAETECMTRTSLIRVEREGSMGNENSKCLCRSTCFTESILGFNDGESGLEASCVITS